MIVPEKIKEVPTCTPVGCDVSKEQLMSCNENGFCDSHECMVLICRFLVGNRTKYAFS